MNDNLRAVKGVVIDAGHGGEDPGASGNGIIEKNLNLENSLYMYKRLNELGIPVTLTRNSDETLERKERIRRILDAYGNSSDVILISNHINAGGGDGAEVVYALRNNDRLAKSILENIGAAGQNMRKYYQRRLPSDPSKDYYFIQRDTGNLQSVLVEYGFLDSKGDDVEILKTKNLDLVEGVVKAIADYIGVTYIPPVGSNTYVVKKGDNLYSIANNYNISVEELKNLNNLTSNILQIGQVLNLPTKETPSEYEVYIVKKGDSLYSIANKFNVNVDDIISLNNLGTTLLQIDQQILIPKKEVDEKSIYIVKKGDSLYSIAIKYGLTADDLKKANNKTSNVLQIGEQLYIPGLTTEIEEPKSEEITYIVQLGDSLWSIAKKYGINVNDLKSYNNLTTNLLQIGQKLLIPGTKEYKTYTVKVGDTLYNIANINNTTVDELKSLNNLKNNDLSIGQVLILP